ncbi:MAG TPA: hypothetical protein VJ927_04230 [Actinomycetota bacterium]|nr:hypothetical protein [Actinomycetota bacterium]
MVGYDKDLQVVCGECGETMEVVEDYGVKGQVLKCKVCGYYTEEIDLRESTLSTFQGG